MSNNQIIYDGFSTTTKSPRMTEKMKVTAALNEAARSSGLSYGQYVSKLHMAGHKIKFPEWVKRGGSYEDQVLS